MYAEPYSQIGMFYKNKLAYLLERTALRSVGNYNYVLRLRDGKK